MKFLSNLTCLTAIALIIYCSFNSPKTISQPLLSCDLKKDSVYDGDNLIVICNGLESKIRFSCIDAPEIKQPQGIASRDHLRSLLNQAGSRVRVRPVKIDRYGRTVAAIYTNNGLIQLQLVKAGWVWAYPKYKSDCAEWEAIALGEQEAQRTRRGIWAGHPIPPWEWRAINRR